MNCTIHTSGASDLEKAMEEVFASYRRERGEKPYDFVMIALSYRYPVERVTGAIERHVEGRDYLAFHSTDSFCDTRIVNEGVTALFISFERGGKVECFVGREISSQKETVLTETVSYLKERSEAAHLMVAGLCHNQMAFFVNSLSEHEIPTNNILGGISSGFTIDGETNTYQFCRGEVIRDGFVIVTFHHVQMASSVAMGFGPVGTQYTITKAEGYRLYEVDNGHPFSQTIQKLTEHIEDFEAKYLWYTPVVILEDGKRQELLTLRTFRNMSEEWVEFYGPVKEGQLIKLSYGEAEDLLDADKKSVRKLKQELPDPELLINFSCTARQYVLEESQEAENIAYLEEMKAPLFGFFTFGEIGHDPQKKSLQFYNETSLLIGMREQ